MLDLATVYFFLGYKALGIKGLIVFSMWYRAPILLNDVNLTAGYLAIAMLPSAAMLFVLELGYCFYRLHVSA